MGKQIGFYATENDCMSLFTFAEQLGCLALPELTKFDPEEQSIEEISPSAFTLPKDQRYFYLLPTSFPIVDAFYQELPSYSCWKLMANASPVVQIIPSQYKGNVLSNGRLYFNMEFDDPRYKKTLDFYRKLRRFVHGWNKIDQFNFYVGPDASQLAQKNSLTLKHFRHKLKVI